MSPDMIIFLSVYLSIYLSPSLSLHYFIQLFVLFCDNSLAAISGKIYLHNIFPLFPLQGTNYIFIYWHIGSLGKV